MFDFQLGRDRAGPEKFLGQWAGILQTDGYQAYNGISGKGLVQVGCWAHARRKFIDAVKVNGKDVEAINMVRRMDALFLVDREAKGLSAEERSALRREHADEWVREIHERCLLLMAEYHLSHGIGWPDCLIAAPAPASACLSSR